MPSPSPVNKDSSIATGSSRKAIQPEEDAINQDIINAFIYRGRAKDEAEQWIRTSLRITRLYLQGSFPSQRERWKERYPSTSLEDIHKAVTSEIGAALWYLDGGVEEKYAEPPAWMPTPGLEKSIRTGELMELLAENPKSPDDINAENQIGRLKKELERLPARVQGRRVEIPYRLKNAPDWKLIRFGEKGKDNGHFYLPIKAYSTPITDAELAEIREARQSDYVTIEEEDG